MSNFHFVNLWKYWKRDYLTRDLTLIEINLYDRLWGGTRFVLLNIGFVWKWNNRSTKEIQKAIQANLKGDIDE